MLNPYGYRNRELTLAQNKAKLTIAITGKVYERTPTGELRKLPQKIVEGRRVRITLLNGNTVHLWREGGAIMCDEDGVVEGVLNKPADPNVLRLGD